MKLAIMVTEQRNGRVDINVYPPGEHTASALVGLLTLAANIIMTKYNPAAGLPQRTMPSLEELQKKFARELVDAEGRPLKPDDPRIPEFFRNFLAQELVPNGILPGAAPIGETPSDEDEPKPNGPPKLRGL